MKKNHQGPGGGGGRPTEQGKQSAKQKAQKLPTVPSQATVDPLLGLNIMAQAPSFAASNQFADQHPFSSHHSSLGVASSIGLTTSAVPISSPLVSQPTQSIAINSTQSLLPQDNTFMASHQVHQTLEQMMQTQMPQTMKEMMKSAETIYRSKQGSDSSQLDQLGKELEIYASRGNSDMVQDILDRHSDAIPKKIKNVSLRAAVKGCTTATLENAIDCVTQLIDCGANINSEEASEGKTALIMACEKGYLELVKNLLDHDALIDHKDQCKRTPLMYAIGTEAENTDVVELLLDRGADVNEPTLTGLTPLLLATKKGHAQIVKLLLKREVKIAAQFPEDLNSPLHYACILAQVPILQELLQHCSKKLSDQQTREFLYLENKDRKNADQLASELVAQEPAVEARNQIFSQLRNLYSAKEKEIEDAIQTLLKKEEVAPNQQPSAAQNNSAAASTEAGTSRKSKRQLAAAAQNNLNSGMVVQQLADEPTAEEFKVQGELESEADKNSILAKQQQSGKSKKKKKGSSQKTVELVPEETKDLSPMTVTDEDEFKSAESKTPPKDRYLGVQDKVIKDNTNDDSTVTEHSSDDEDQFEEARSSQQTAAAATLAAASSTQSSAKQAKKKTNKDQPKGEVAVAGQGKQQPAKKSNSKVNTTKTPSPPRIIQQAQKKAKAGANEPAPSAVSNQQPASSKNGDAAPAAKGKTNNKRQDVQGETGAGRTSGSTSKPEKVAGRGKHRQQEDSVRAQSSKQAARLQSYDETLKQRSARGMLEIVKILRLNSDASSQLQTADSHEPEQDVVASMSSSQTQQLQVPEQTQVKKKRKNRRSAKKKKSWLVLIWRLQIAHWNRVSNPRLFHLVSQVATRATHRDKRRSRTTNARREAVLRVPCNNLQQIIKVGHIFSFSKPSRPQAPPAAASKNRTPQSSKTSSPKKLHLPKWTTPTTLPRKNSSRQYLRRKCCKTMKTRSKCRRAAIFSDSFPCNHTHHR